MKPRTSTAKIAVMAMAALAVAFLVIGNFSNQDSKNLEAALGQYSYNSKPIDYNASNFACNPGPIQPADAGKYAGSYNTYWHGYSEGYANSGVKGSWCQNYLPSIQQDPTLYDDPPLKSSTSNDLTDHAKSYISGGVYKVTDASGNEDTTNNLYRRWQYHVEAAKKHENIVMIYENSLQNYGTYYMTGAAYGGDQDSYSGLYGDSVVHCPAGAIVVDHKKFGSTVSSQHLYNQNSNQGMYDGQNHMWCELNGVAVNPEMGPEPGKGMPDLGSGYAMLYKFTFPDGTAGGADYYKYYKNGSYLTNVGSPESDWVKCANGIAGPFVDGVNTHNVSQYESESNKNKAKIPHYHCLGSGGYKFAEPIKDDGGPAAPYNTYSFKSIKYSETTASAGDSANGGADTVGSIGKACARGTYWCQTSDAKNRYCSSTPDCTGKFNPPAPSWTISAPKTVKLASSKTTFNANESVEVKGDFGATGTEIPYGMATATVEFSKDIKFATIDYTSYSTQNVTSTGSSISVWLYPSQAGTYYVRMKMSLGDQTSDWTTSSTLVTVSGSTSTNSTSGDSSLVGYWKFDGNGNNEVSTNPNATTVGNASFKSSDGKMGGYLYIPSMGDYAKIPYNSVFDLSDSFTIEFWFRQRAKQSFFQDLVYKGTAINNYNFRIFRQLWNEYNNGPIITGYTASGTGYWTQTSNSNDLAHDTWHHVAFVKDSTRRAYYLDGAEIHSATDAPTAKTPKNDIIVGDSAIDTDIDSLKIYNRALSASEIAARGPFPVTNNDTNASSWKEVIWNDLGLKSYVSINAPQSIIDAAKKACEKTKPENVTWPNSSDFTKPETAGIPSCGTSDKTIPTIPPASWKEVIWNDLGLKSYVSINAPQSIIDAAKKTCEKTKPENVTWPNSSDFSKPETAGIPSCGGSGEGGNIVQGPKSCAIGEKCSTGSWCNNGKQCYNSDNTFSCVEWEKACPTGTKRCMPFDTKCIEPGSSGQIDGYCMDAVSCYSSDKKQKFCKTWNGGVTGYSNLSYEQPSCPASFPKQCGPNDSNCTELYETGSPNSWCASGGKQCYKPDGNLYCVKMNEDCPKEASSACKPEDKYCTEPEKYGPKDGWCAMGSVQFYKKDGSGIYCAKLPANDPQAWENVTAPLDTGRCKTDDKYCLGELGKTGPSGSWCAVGMQKWNKDGSITCVSGKDYKPEDVPMPPPMPVIDICAQVSTVGFNPATLECKTFASPCNIPADWTTVTDGRVCKNSKLGEIDTVITDDGLIEHAKERYNYLVTLVHQAREIPEFYTGIAAFREKLSEARLRLKEIFNYSDTTKMKQELREFLKTILPEIERQWNEMMPNVRAFTFKKEIEKELESYRKEFAAADSTSDYAKKLKEGIEKIESLFSSIDSQSDQSREAVMTAITQVRGEIAELIRVRREGKISDSFEGTVVEVISAAEEFNRFVQEKAIKDNKVLFMMERLQKVISDLKNTTGNAPERSKLLDQAIWLKGRLNDWLAGYGYKQAEALKVNEILDYIDKAVAEKMDILVEKISNKMEILIDNVTQRLTQKIAEVAQKFAEDFSQKYEEKAAIVLANLAAMEAEERQQISESTGKILGKIEDLDKAIGTANLTAFRAQSLKETMELLASTTWCGQNAEVVQTRINTIGLVLESGEATPEEIDDFRREIESFKSGNSEICYKEGLIAFKDSGLEDWHNQYAQYNYRQGWVTGYKDSDGNRLGQLGVGNPTLRIEALAMVMRLFEIAEGRTDVLEKPLKGVPTWGIGYVNGAINSGIKFDWSLSMDQPISRLEAAKLFVSTMESIQDQTFFTPATEIRVADDRYNDWSLVIKDKDGALAVEALTDVGIFQGGGDGGFHPYDSLLRSEFVTTNKRLAETYDLLH